MKKNDALRVSEGKHQRELFYKNDEKDLVYRYFSFIFEKMMGFHHITLSFIPSLKN